MSAIFFPQRDFQGGKLNKLPWFIRVIMRAKVHILLVENYTHTPTLLHISSTCTFLHTSVTKFGKTFPHWLNFKQVFIYNLAKF